MTFLERVCETLNREKIGYLVVGGYAVALHGAVRGTLDIDIALHWSKNNLLQTEFALNSMGLISRLPLTAMDLFTYRDEYIRNRNLIAWNFNNPDDLSEQLDVIVNYDASGKKAVSKKLPGATVPILNIEDLIRMKKTSGRQQDLEDVRALEKLN